jgi:hypothetical protein
MTPLRTNWRVNESEFEKYHRHPGLPSPKRSFSFAQAGEGRDPCLMPLAGGAMDPGLRRGGGSC